METTEQWASQVGVQWGAGCPHAMTTPRWRGGRRPCHYSGWHCSCLIRGCVGRLRCSAPLALARPSSSTLACAPWCSSHLIQCWITHSCYVLADTSYGACCVDVVAAQHVAAQGIVHFGDACMSVPPGVAVLYVFDQSATATPELEALVELHKATHSIILSTRYHHLHEHLGDAACRRVRGLCNDCGRMFGRRCSALVVLCSFVVL
jgi:hypothetical protein